ncbi:MAG TPA: beta-propeller fold lactonase family protein [Burkholderiales bacterium]|nr:beta-propeller fold lactonase family protein [Burkholderiales bacterium]
MLKTVVLLAAFITVPAFAAPFAYVSNQQDGVTVIDLDTLEPVATIDIQGKEPRGIGITPDGKYVLTANKDSGNISVIDTATREAVKHIAIGKNPEFIRVYHNRAYVSYEPSAGEGAPEGEQGEKSGKEEQKKPAGIAVLDLENWRLIETMLSGPETEGIEFSPDGKLMLVTNEGDNTVTVYNISNGKLVKTIDTTKYGNRPRGIKVSPDGKMYAVTLEFSNKLLILSRKLDIIKTVPTGDAPYGLAFDRQGKRLFVAAARSKQLQVFNTKNFSLIKNIPIGARCWHFSFTPDDARILVACGRSNNLYVVDAKTYEPVKIISGLKIPWGVVTYPKAVGSLDRP